MQHSDGKTVQFQHEITRHWLATTPARRSVALASLAASALLAACGGGDEPAPGSRPLAESCASFAPSGLPNGARLAGTELREAAGPKPRACIVRGTIKSSDVSTITWAVELPEGTDWNGKTLTVGGGGFDGFIPTDDDWYHLFVMGSSSAPFVRIGSNSGHDTQGFDWGNDEAALRNHAYEANHLVLQVGIKLATAFYGKAPAHRYMVGHSNGGRSALMAAGRYPDDYHGVLALAPAISQQPHQVSMGPNNRWLYDPSVPAEANWISPAKSALYAAAEIAACDGLDGLADGVISNPEACTYVPVDLKCADDAAGIKDETCLTSGQIEAIRLNYSDKALPLELANGMSGYERYGRGGAATGDWQWYAFGFEFDGDFFSKGFSYIAPTTIIQVLTGDPSADSVSHDPLTIPSKWQALAEIMEPMPTLSAFRQRGGKLLVWYGMADTCVSVYRTASYLDLVRQDSGDSQYRNFTRFVTSPAVGHDFEGPGAASADMLTALVNWVEKGEAPDALVAAKRDGQGEVQFQRPLCEYPAYPHYDGGGDPDDAASFTCRVHGAP